MRRLFIFSCLKNKRTFTEKFLKIATLQKKAKNRQGDSISNYLAEMDKLIKNNTKIPNSFVIEADVLNDNTF